MVLLLDHVKKAFRQPGGTPLPILDIERFEMSAGEQVVLLGRSGCGKTTLLHTIAGITKADSGRIVIDGTDVSRFSQAGRDRVRARKIGYVFQTFHLLPAFTALGNVLLGMTFSGKEISRKRAEHWLERVGLGHRLHHKPRTLSVGEQQRVAVARALATQPRLLLADEPTANVDPGNQQMIVDLLREICREEGVGLLMVTHAMEVANQFQRIERLEQINRIAASSKPISADLAAT